MPSKTTKVTVNLGAISMETDTEQQPQVNEEEQLDELDNLEAELAELDALEKGEEDPEVHSGSQDKQPIEDDVVEADVAAHEQQAQVDEVGELAELAAVASAELESVELDNNESDKAQETVTEAEDAAALHSAEIATEEPTEGAEEPAADESGVDAAPEPAAPEPTPPPKPASVPVGPAAGKRRGISLAPKVVPPTKPDTATPAPAKKQLAVPYKPAVSKAPAAAKPKPAADGAANGEDEASKGVKVRPKPVVDDAKPKPPKPAAGVAKPRVPKPDAAETKPKAPKPVVAKPAAVAKPNSESKGEKGNKRPHATSAYMMFTNAKRASVKEEDPSLGICDVSKRIAQLWKDMGAEEKQTYQALADAANVDIKERQAEWDAANPGAEKVKKGKVSEKSEKKAVAAPKPRPDPSTMKRPVTAQGLFNKERRPELVLDNPGASFGDITQLLAAEWAGMDEEDKATWKDLARKSMEEYAEAMTAAEDACDGMATAAIMEVDDPEGSVGGIKPKATGNKRPRAPSKGGKGRKKRGKTAADAMDDSQETPAEEPEEEEEEQPITSEPEAIIAHDHSGKYWVKLSNSNNFYDFVFVKADKIKQLRNKEVAEVSEDDGFNGWGSRLLQCVDEYEAYRRQFDLDARELLDPHGGLNFDLMRPGSFLDMCAVLGTLQERDVGGLLSQIPKKKATAVRGIADRTIHVPAMMLSLVCQRMVNVWRDRALRAESQLASVDKAC